MPATIVTAMSPTSATLFANQPVTLSAVFPGCDVTDEFIKTLLRRSGTTPCRLDRLERSGTLSRLGESYGIYRLLREFKN
jgi:hypothetical protein